MGIQSLTRKSRTHWINLFPTDFKPCMMKYILKRWQDSWDQQIHNKLHKIHSLVDKTPCSYGQNRTEQVVLTRCHSRLTHSYLLNNEERPECSPCNSSYSLDCVDVADIRQTLFNSSMLTIYMIYLQMSQATQI